MKKTSKVISVAAVAVLGQFSTNATAQDTPGHGVALWQALDEELRQAIVEEISARRGLDPNGQNPDWLIRSSEDIAEVLRVSCDFSGACADADGRATLGENLTSFPSYDEQQGLLNAASIRRMKSE